MLKPSSTIINYHGHIWMGLYNEWPLIITILTRSNTLGKTCLEESLELHIKDMRYENNIPAGMYRRVAIITQPIAWGGDSEGGCKTGISVNNSITGIDATMPSEIRRSSQYTKDDTPDTLSKWRIFICDRTLSFYYTVSVVIKKVTIGLSLNWNLFKLSVWWNFLFPQIYSTFRITINHTIDEYQNFPQRANKSNLEWHWFFSLLSSMTGLEYCCHLFRNQMQNQNNL